ncbi:MAG: guanylate kinase [candidate division Zixibacteria bacterium]|nr:guanylate kinase [candidate division Zixibacteria bacterium]
MNLRKPGKIIVISSPSGGGKTSICRSLPERDRDHDWYFSVSYTTRGKRAGEQNGREYFFVDDNEFERLISEDAFAEECRVHLYRYGTPREPLEKVLNEGGVMLLDVDVQGAEKIKAAYPQAVSIFILPPSVDELRQRLTTRGTETQEQLRVRRDNATKEMQLWQDFDYVVVNDDLEVAVSEVLSVITGHYCRTDMVPREQIQKIIGLVS